MIAVTQRQRDRQAAIEFIQQAQQTQQSHPDNFRELMMEQINSKSFDELKILFAGCVDVERLSDLLGKAVGHTILERIEENPILLLEVL